jgi:hypothetical protein
MRLGANSRRAAVPDAFSVELMLSRVTVVHKKSELLNALSGGLTQAGYAVARFTDPMAALRTLETTHFAAHHAHRVRSTRNNAGCHSGEDGQVQAPGAARPVCGATGNAGFLRRRRGAIGNIGKHPRCSRCCKAIAAALIAAEPYAAIKPLK